MRRSPPPALPVALALALAAPVAAQEREEILSYDVAIEVRADGWLEITESIRVVALGDEIRRGIYRDIPTSFPRQSGLGRIAAPLEVVHVTRDGHDEPYVVQSVGGPASRGGIRVRIGNENVLLEHGEHDYALTYRTTRWIAFGDERDELYWNVTGNGWAFPIRSASARIVLPGSTDASRVTLEGWTGPDGSTGSAFRADVTRDGLRTVASFRTTGPLGPQEGLTVRVRFPAGLVSPPSPEQEAAWFKLDWGPWIDAGLMTLLILALYLFMWVRVGRDPPARHQVVQYEPPEGYSPAALGYIESRGYRARHLVAAIVSLGVQGALRIERDGRKWIVRTVGPAPAGASPEERQALSGIASAGGRLTLSGTSNPVVRRVAKEVRGRLRTSLARDYFVTNRAWFAAGVAFTVAGFAALAWRARFDIAPEGWFMGVWLSFWTLGVGMLVATAYRQWRQALSGDPLAWVGAIFITLFSLPFVGAEIFVGTILWRAVPQQLALAAVVLAGINVLFFELLERPTLKGRGVLDQLEGFTAYLGATDEDRFDRLQPPDRSLELFERYLPYAIALGLENRWAKRFEDVLDVPEEARGGTGTSSWYHGGGHGASGMATALGSAFSSSLSASSAAPSSSGGGGGGGSSGGGGGGGGGGGW